MAWAFEHFTINTIDIKQKIYLITMGSNIFCKHFYRFFAQINFKIVGLHEKLFLIEASVCETGPRKEEILPSSRVLEIFRFFRKRIFPHNCIRLVMRVSSNVSDVDRLKGFSCGGRPVSESTLIMGRGWDGEGQKKKELQVQTWFRASGPIVCSIHTEGGAGKEDEGE